MRKNLVTLVFMSLIILISSAVHAQDAKVLAKQKNAAKAFLNATPAIIKKAVTQKKSNKKSIENIGVQIAKAFDHQKHAVELYNAEKYEKAILHSLKARKYAALSIKENKGDFEETANPETVFKDFKDRNLKIKDEEKDKTKERMKEIDKYYKNMKDAFKYKKDASIGAFESELDSGIEQTEDDEKIDLKQLTPIKDVVK